MSSSIHVDCLFPSDAHKPECFYDMLGSPGRAGCFCDSQVTTQFEAAFGHDPVVDIFDTRVGTVHAMPASITTAQGYIGFSEPRILAEPHSVFKFEAVSPSLSTFTPSPLTEYEFDPTPYFNAIPLCTDFYNFPVFESLSQQSTPQLTHTRQIPGPSSVGPVRRTRRSRKSRRAFDQDGFTIIMVTPEEASRPAGQRRSGKAKFSLQGRRGTSLMQESLSRKRCSSKRLDREPMADLTCVAYNLTGCHGQGSGFDLHAAHAQPVGTPAPMPPFPRFSTVNSAHIPELDLGPADAFDSPRMMFKQEPWTTY